MKTWTLLSLIVIGFASSKALAEDDISKRYFSGQQNQLQIAAGVSSRSDGFEDFYSFNVQYSQPNRFFRLPGRINAEVGAGFGEDDYKQRIAGLSQDLLYSFNDRFYAGVGLGGYIKSKQTDRIESKYTFGERAFVGYSMEQGAVELYIRHYSNGSVTTGNAGQNFVGLAYSWHF